MGIGSRTMSWPGSRCGEVLSAARRWAMGLSDDTPAGRGGKGYACGVILWEGVLVLVLGAASAGSINQGRELEGADEEEDGMLDKARFAMLSGARRTHRLV